MTWIYIWYESLFVWNYEFVNVINYINNLNLSNSLFIPNTQIYQSQVKKKKKTKEQSPNSNYNSFIHTTAIQNTKNLKRPNSKPQTN